MKSDKKIKRQRDAIVISTQGTAATASIVSSRLTRAATGVGEAQALLVSQEKRGLRLELNTSDAMPPVRDGGGAASLGDVL